VECRDAWEVVKELGLACSESPALGIDSHMFIFTSDYYKACWRRPD
jgi:hypothetical protein